MRHISINALKRPMCNSLFDKDRMPIEAVNMKDSIKLKLSDDISLIHDVSVNCGKTTDMAKGLFLCCKGRLCAGESAGMGLPVLKTTYRTIFPTLFSARVISETAMEKVFQMDRILVWHIAGRKTPAWFSQFVEKLVGVFMKMPPIQHPLLKLRTIVMSCLNIQSSMVPGPDRGRCRVVYETTPKGLIVKVDGRSIIGQGRLLMLNEVDGSTFDKLETNDHSLHYSEIPAWKKVSFNTLLTSTVLNAGFSLTPGATEDCSSFQVFCGREVALGLNWAGLAITNTNHRFMYIVNIHCLEPIKKAFTSDRPGLKNNTH
jgi:hypothetical protein